MATKRKKDYTAEIVLRRARRRRRRSKPLDCVGVPLIGLGKITADWDGHR